MKMDTWYLQYVIVPLAIMLVAFILSQILRKVLGKFVKIASQKLNVDPTKYNFLKNALSFIIFILAVILIFSTIPELKNYGLTLFASAGVIAAIVGFASQSAFSNIISGIFIVFFKPFRVGDIISIGNTYSGTVEDITLRHTVINNYENRRIVIPNAVISDQTIINSTLNEAKVCIFLEMGISYDSDINRAMNIMREEAESHPNLHDNRTKEDVKDKLPKVVIRVIGFGDSSVNLRAYLWADSPGEGFVMKCDLHLSIKERFDTEGIEIPYPYRTIVYKDKEKNL